MTITYQIPFIYILLIRILEPASALGGTYLATFHPYYFVGALTGIDQSILDEVELLPDPLSPKQAAAIQAIILNLGASYALFCLLGWLIMGVVDGRTEYGMRVWKAVIFAQLVSDIGHIGAFTPWAKVLGTGYGYLWKFWTWNYIAWGNLGVLWIVGFTRLAFLLGLGVTSKKEIKKRK